MGGVHNALPLALSNFGINNNHRFLGLRIMILLDRAIRKYLCNRFIFNVTWPIIISIEWQVQYARLNNLRIMQLQYYRDMLVEIEIIAIDIPSNYVIASTIGIVLHNGLCHQYIVTNQYHFWFAILMQANIL